MECGSHLQPWRLIRKAEGSKAFRRMEAKKSHQICILAEHAERGQYIEFEGLFSESVLGIFRIIRGFADLRDLVAVSVPHKMEVT